MTPGASVMDGPVFNREAAREATGSVLLAAGGTGGHIYPAAALAQSLARLAPGLRIQFICGSRPAELQIYRRMGIEPWTLPVAHNRPGPIERLKFLADMHASWRMARRLLRKNPVDVAVGFGSYVSLPPLFAARLGGARIVLHEQNVHAGAANRWLAPIARWIAAADEPGGGVFPADRTRVVGNPLRAEMLEHHDRAEARKYFRLGQDRLVCLCVGGSQGAAGLNKILLELTGRMTAEDSRAGQWQLLWATGADHYKPISESVGRMDNSAAGHMLTPFIERMGMAYAAADLVIARAGALTLAELTALGKPAVLVPLPTAAAGHQQSNARAIEAKGAAVMLMQSDPRAAEKLETWLADWADHPEKLAAMAEKAKALGKPRAADELAALVLEQVNAVARP